MSRRLAWTLPLVVLLTLSVVASGRTQERPLVAAELHQKAWQQGTVRVLVQLQAPYVAEPSLPSPAHVMAQRQNIAATQSLVRDRLRGLGHRVVRDYGGSLPVLALHVGPDGLRMLESLRGVVTHVVEDRLRPPLLTESVPRIQANQTTALGYDGTGSVIVVMDTGVDTAHPFFQDGLGQSRVIAEACFSTNDPAHGITSLCPGGVDTSIAPGSGLNCPAFLDGCDHGTHVAGIAAGRGTGIAGVAPGAQLVAIQVFSRSDDPDECGAIGSTAPCIGVGTSDLLAAGSYVLNTLLQPPMSLNIAAINLSLGGDAFSIPCDGAPGILPAEVQLINDLRAQGTATVAASGNEFLNGLVADPACIGSAISVGTTTDPPEAIASFSNRAPGMSLLAPGVSITSSVPGGGFASFSGTSMATPHVAGAFAVVRQAVPTATVSDALAALQSTGQPIGGFKRIRLFDALGTFPGVVPTIQFSSATYSEIEGDATHPVPITLTRTGPADVLAVATSTVVFSTGGGTAIPGTTGTADYVPVAAQVVTFLPGETTKTVLVTIRGDFTIEPNETVGLTVSAPGNAMLGVPRTATLTIVNDDVPGTIAFDGDSFSVNEAAGSATITLRRTGGLAAGTTAMVSTGSGTAVAGADYTALVNKVVTFAGGADTATFTVAIVNNTLDQADKTMGLSITGVGPGATVGVQNTATLTIVNDDVAGSAQFSVANYQVTEGTATATITVTRTGGTASGATVQYRAVPTGLAGDATGGGVDYTLSTGTLSFGVNETTKTFTVAIVNDAIIEGDETVNLELVNPTGGLTLGAPSIATLTIHDNDAPTFKFGSATYSVAEGAAVSAMVVRANGLGSVVTVDYAVQGSSTAVGGLDYTLLNGTVTFGAGVTSQPIAIPTLQDTLFEGSETIVIKLVNPSAGTIIAPDTTTVTITDNDTPGTMQFSAATYGVDENVGPAPVRVTRTGANLASNVTVQFTTTNGTATTPADYADATQVLTFAAGETFKAVPITIVDDAVAEGNRTVVLTLSAPSSGAALGAIKTAVLTIRDDEQGLQFSAPAYVVTEAMPSVTITVVRTGPPVGTVTVDYASAAGSATPGADYTDVSGTLTFGPGIANRTFTVPIINDTVFEVAESVALLLNNPGGAQLGPLDTSTITIVDNDPPGAVRFSAATYTVAEAMAVATITVQRTSGATASAVTVNYATVAGGTATAGADYLLTSGTLAFKSGETSKTFTIPILNDKLAEPSETVNLALANPTGGATLGTPSTAVLTITDDDLAGVITFSAPTFTVVENAGPAVIKVNRTGAAGGVTVDFTTADGTATQPADYTATNQTLSFAAGEMSKTVGIPIVAGDGREGNETVRLILSNPTGGATLGTVSQAVLTIIDSDTGPVVGFGAPAFTVAENVAGGMASITIVRSGGTAAGQTVLFSTAGGTATGGVDYTAVTSQPAVFSAGQTTATVKVPIINNTEIASVTRTVNLGLSVGGPNPIPTVGTPATAVLTILEDDAMIRFASAAYNVVEGGVATLTVTRTGGTVGSATVAYATSNGSATAPGAYTAKAGTLTFGPGVTSQTITVTTLGNTVVDDPRTFTVTLSSPGPAGTALDGSNATATVTITDDDAVGSLQFSSATYSVAEGAAAILTVTRTGGSAGTLTVAYATSDGGGGGTPATGGLPSVAGTDYTPTAGVLTFATGMTSRTITVPTKADTLLEGPETFTVTLSPPIGGAAVGVPSTAVVTIVDAQAPRLQFAAANYAVAESAGSVTLAVQRVGPTTAQNTVDYTLAGVTATGGGDFVSTGGTLTFAPGIASRPIVVPIVDDTINETAETFTVTLSNPTGGALLGTPGTATVTITDNDPAGAVQFSQVSYAVIEGETASITVTRTGTSGPVTVDFATSDGTATAPDDYTPAAGTLTFQAGETTKTFTVATTTDLLTEGAESVTLTLSGATNGLWLGSQSTATLWILDRQQSVQFSSASASVVEGKAVTIAVTRSGVPDGTVTVDYQVGVASTATIGADFTLAPAPGTLTFLPGVTTRTINVQAVNDSVPHLTKAIVVLELVNPGGATPGTPGAITITLVDNDRPDLVVTALTAPAQAATGLPMTVVATVGNVGGGMAPATSLGIFVSDSSATPGEGVQIGIIAIPALAGGASFTATGAVNVPPLLPPGTYFVSAVADAQHVVIELDDTNNGLTAPTQVEVVLFQTATIGGTAFFVSPAGNDFNPGTIGQPFRTIAKARDTVRVFNGNMTSDITVYLRGGEYALTETLELTQSDSGSNGFNVVYQAYPGEHPVLTGGQRITGWTAVGGGIYKAPVPAGTPPFRQLYSNGTRAIRARTPNVGAYNQLLSWNTGALTIEINASEISAWSRLDRVEMVILGRGVNQANLRIASFNVPPAGASAFVTPSEPERTRIFEQTYPPKESRPYFFENALEFLDAPGEWYLDTDAGEVYYMPMPGENMATVSVVVPGALETLLRIRGDLDAPAHHLQVRGLTFEHSTWLAPNGEGYVGDQASIVFTDPLPDDQLTSYPGIRLPAAIHIEAAHDTRLERNVLRHLGGAAVNYFVGTHDNQFIGNLITDVSGGGVSVDLNLEGNPADGRKISRNDVIRNNYIEKTGRDYYQTVGIMAGYTDGIVIEHNELHDMPYSGISVGWGWANAPNAAQNNLVRYNRVWNVLNTMADGGALYTLSRQPGTIIAENYVTDIVRFPWLGGFETNGVFCDVGSDQITVQDNVFANIDDQDIRFNDAGTITLIDNGGSSPAVRANAGLESAYRDIRP